MLPICIQPGTNSIVDGMKRAKERGTHNLYLEEGVHIVTEKYVVLTGDWKITGAGQDKTFVQGGFKMQGTKETAGKRKKGKKKKSKKKKMKRVVLKDMTIKGSSANGLNGNDDDVSFLCDSITITQCGEHGVYAENTKGRFINCVITQCERSGILCRGNCVVELEGNQTRIEGNVFGLHTIHTGSIIHLLFPLTKESVSTNNQSGNYVGDGEDNNSGTIETISSFE